MMSKRSKQELTKIIQLLPEVVSVLEREEELLCSSEMKTLWLSSSCSTIDRCLQRVMHASPKGISTTKPGTLLKKSIPVPTWREWDDTIPGFVEMDLVAHCGESARGQFLYTLTAVDVSTGWTECLAIPNKTQIAVSAAIKAMRLCLPFPLLGINCVRVLNSLTRLLKKGYIRFESGALCINFMLF
jgi:hypothetical protein